MKMVRRFLHALTLGRNDTGKEENMDKMTELMTRYPQLEGCRESIEKAMDLLRSMYAKGGKLLACGNGGSSADCEHIVGELMKSFLIHRPMTQEVKASLEEKFPEDAEKFYSCMQRGIPAISLPSQTAVLSAYVNDVDPEFFYAQLVHGYGRVGDVVLCISTSGNSKNVVRAAQMAKALGLGTLALTGQKDSKLSALCDVTVRVPEIETFKIQELHLPVYHYLCAQLEEELFG